MTIIESACKWAWDTANDPKVGYSQAKRGTTSGGITYWDCSAFVTNAYKQAGVPIEGYPTTSMMVHKSILTKYGFKRIEGTASPKNLGILQKGDILVYNRGGKGHTVLYQGNGQISHASTGKKPLADQVLNAKLESEFTHIFRYTGGGNATNSSSSSSSGGGRRSISNVKLSLNPIVLNQAYFDAFITKLKELYSNDSSTDSSSDSSNGDEKDKNKDSKKSNSSTKAKAKNKEKKKSNPEVVNDVIKNSTKTWTALGQEVKRENTFKINNIIQKTSFGVIGGNTKKKNSLFSAPSDKKDKGDEKNKKDDKQAKAEEKKSQEDAKKKETTTTGNTTSSGDTSSSSGDTSSSSGDTAQAAAEAAATTIDMKIATYKYLKLINDRWLCFENSYEEVWEYSHYKDRWIFMDSFYNKNGDELIPNVKEVIRLLFDAQTAQDMPVIGLLSNIYADAHCTMHTIHNFLDTTNVNGQPEPEKLARIFKPIPYRDMNLPNGEGKTMWDLLDVAMPYQVVLYSSEYSKKLGSKDTDADGNRDMGDGFNVWEDGDLSPNLPIAITSRNSESSYTIPCFGVNYGRQYQSYFKDISISTNSPIVSATALKAQFIIALQNAQNATSDSRQKFHTVGQDLYTIYSNNAYTCTVKMLGCAYIQPLMYFQLNNINMFSGTYIIQKVTHHIQPGHMETTFIGTRMANTSTKLVEDWLIATGGGSGSGDGNGESQEDRQGKAADVDNDCMYKHYTPGGGGGNADLSFPSNQYDMATKAYADKFNVPGNEIQWRIGSNSSYGGIDAKDVKVVEVLGHVAHGEGGVTATTKSNTNYNLHGYGIMTVTFNDWAFNSQNLTKWVSTSRHATTPGHGIGHGNTYAQEMARKIFTNPATLIGVKPVVLHPVPIFDGGKQTGKMSNQDPSGNLTEKHLNMNNLYCSQAGYDINDHSNTVKEAKGGKLWKDAHYSYHQSMTEKFSSIISHSRNNEAWHASAPPTQKSNNSSSNDGVKKKLQDLLSSIQSTLSYSEKLSSITLADLEVVGTSSMHVKAKSGKGEDNARIFDAIVNCYYNDVCKVLWVTKGKDMKALPEHIQVTIGGDKKVIAMSEQGGNVYRINYQDDVNTYFLKTIKKKYGASFSSSSSLDELPNFTTATTEKGKWSEYMNKMLEKVTIEACPISAQAPSSGGGSSGGGSGVTGASGQFSGKSKEEKWSMCGLNGTKHNDSTVQSLLTTIDINGVKVTINKHLVADLQAIVAEIKQKVPTFKFNVSSSYRTSCSAGCNSRHQFGVAIDINAGSGGNPWFVHNITPNDWTYNKPLGSAKPWSTKTSHYGGTYDKDKCIWSWDHPVVKIFNAHGWGWGGGYGDVMHFSISTTPVGDGRLQGG